ncbi:MAG TPA: hypothetical protein ENG51_07635 [Deltaproteobacteria bacterium]|nr:hypothetical protein [Deltaproteobacteria bacterium]
MALTGIHKFVDTSQSSNGDGSSSNPYNDIDYACDQAPSSPSSESDRWIIWVRGLSSDISISDVISPTNNGSYNAHHMLIGWPRQISYSDYTVDSVPTGTDNLGINKAKWQFVDSVLTQGDNYWMGAEVTFTSGNNNGQTRMVIWFDASTDTIYLDFPLPNDIASGDQYTITLKSEFYDDRPTAPSGWDNDTNIMPVIDGGEGSYDMMNFFRKPYWTLANFELKNGSNTATYRIIYGLPIKCYFLKIHDGGVMIRHSSYTKHLAQADRIFLWDGTYYNGIHYSQNPILFTRSHFNRGNNTTISKGFIVGENQFLTFKDCTFGRVSQVAYLVTDSYVAARIRGENVIVDPNNYPSLSPTSNYRSPVSVKFSGFNCEPNKFRQWFNNGDIYNIDEDAIIDPPSGATTYIKMAPRAGCAPDQPLCHDERRYQASGSKTYTWKFYPVNMSLDATDLEVEAWYLDESSGTHRAYATANPSAYSDDGWHDLSITVNPAQAGTVYFKIKLKKYNTSGCYVALDPKVDVS